MSRQQRKALGTQEFRSFPFVDVEPLPDINVSSYVNCALKAKNLGSRLANPWPSKPFQCRKTGKSYMFWDNYLAHVKKLSPLIGPSTEHALAKYTSPYDDRTFHFRDNLKLHNRVKRFEEAQEIEVFKRLNMDNKDVSEKEIELAVKKKRVDYRFIKKPEKTLEEELADLKKKRRSQLMADAGTTANDNVDDSEEDEPEDGNTEEPNKFTIDVEDPDFSLGRPLLKWPENYDDLEPILRPQKPQRPVYRGWTHSDNADSWFLESHTPDLHSEYNSFTKDLYGKKAICPRLWKTVFPESERSAKSF